MFAILRYSNTNINLLLITTDRHEFILFKGHLMIN